MILSLGADLKGSFAIRRGTRTWYEKGFGDLADAECFHRWADAIEKALDGEAPAMIIVDPHPLYRSHHFGRLLSRRTGARLIEVQHHVAHAEAVRAEHGFQGSYLGLVMDGSGYGPDGTIWGCELLRIEEGRWSRKGHLRAVVCPGGDLAAREIWRMGLAWLTVDDINNPYITIFERNIGSERMGSALAQIRSGRPVTTSAGRAFDAAASIMGLRMRVKEEGEAARDLEEYASKGWPGDRLAYSVADGVLDLAPAMHELAERARDGLVRGGLGRNGAPMSRLAAAFHETYIEGLVDLVVESAGEKEHRVVLSGGCFLNAILSREIHLRLSRRGFKVHQANHYSPGDDALALGQIEVGRLPGSERANDHAYKPAMIALDSATSRWDDASA